MKKRILGILLFIGCLLGLVSCSSTKGINVKNKNVISGKELSYQYTDTNTNQIRKKMDSFEKMLSVENNYDNIINTWNEINSYAYEMYSYANIEYVNFAISSDIKSSLLQTKYNDIFNEIREWEDKMFKLIYESSYKDQFFEGMTEEEIKDLIDNAFPSEYYEYDAKAMELVAEYYEIKEEEIATKVPELYLRYIDNAKKQATSAGYTSYPDYMYDYIYGRDYTPTQVKEFYGYVKQYIVPLLNEIINRYNYYANIAQSLSLAEMLQYYSLYDSINLKSTKINDYAQTMGEKYNSVYKNLWDNGYYYFSNEKKSIQGAFTTYAYTEGKPIVYFGPNYQNQLTVVHEFGHYYAMSVGNGNYGSLDMAETHSQGNEMLYLSYLDKYDIITDVLSGIFECESLLNYCLQIIISTAIDEFEQYCYSATDLKAEELDAKFLEIAGKYINVSEFETTYGMDLKTYWKMVVVENSCYYISYAMSLIPSLYFYVEGQNNFDIAKNKYLEMIDLLETDDVVFLETLDKLNIYNPFNEQTYMSLNTLVQYI